MSLPVPFHVCRREKVDVIILVTEQASCKGLITALHDSVSQMGGED